ncbi:MAG: DNA-deoxyinosine glycosylase [Clostridia bacterium]|nr:DNA-deoxyinosine glycosylase [Clostridia bacterium]
MEKVTHDNIQPVYQEDSQILILGSIPSPKSREYGFYYAHPQNRFWKVLADVYEEPFPYTIEERVSFLYRNKIALWDVLSSCMIDGADDSSIKEPIANNISDLLKHTNIKKIYTTGRKAYDLYNKLCFQNTGVPAALLPSTSPANCRVKYSELLSAYQIVKKGE